jgi:pantetheine-phosphate adenylyltransferase
MSRMPNAAAIYPGTFDPVTNGHLDVIERAANLFPRLIVAAAVNTGKAPLFTMEERVALLRAEVARFPKVEVTSFDGLAVEYARRSGVPVLLRGIRTFTDFEYEFQMALTNRALAPDVETIFVMSNVEWSYTSSRLLKEAAAMGADVSHFVPPRVNEAMKAKLCTRG